MKFLFVAILLCMAHGAFAQDQPLDRFQRARQQQPQMAPAPAPPQESLSEAEDEEILARIIVIRDDVAAIRGQVHELRMGYEDLLTWQGDAISQLQGAKKQLGMAVVAQAESNEMLAAGYRQLQELRVIQGQTRQELQFARGQTAQAVATAQSAQASANAAWHEVTRPRIGNFFGLLAPRRP